jgi:hypothetical protein
MDMLSGFDSPVEAPPWGMTEATLPLLLKSVECQGRVSGGSGDWIWLDLPLAGMLF